MITEKEHKAVKRFYEREAETICIRESISMGDRAGFIAVYMDMHTQEFLDAYRGIMELAEHIHIGVESESERSLLDRR